MSPETPDIQHLSLGDFLRETRQEQGLELAGIAHDTKISMKNLQALEAGDFRVLPAEAFTRGIYALYAKALSLDPEQIVQRYREEQPDRSHHGHEGVSGEKQAPDVDQMAERPSSLAVATIGFGLFFLLMAGGFLCWYFSWNPATYLSQKLRSLQDPPPQIEQAIRSEKNPPFPDPLSFFSSSGPNNLKGYSLFSLSTPTSARAAVSRPTVTAGGTSPLEKPPHHPTVAPPQ